MTSTRNIAGRLNLDHQTVCVFCMSRSYTRTTSRRYRQCSQKILRHESNSAGGSCTVVWKIDFPRRILFTDEDKFARKAVLNSRNSHVWAALPHWFHELYSLNIWAELLDGCVIGPYLLPSNLTGAAYLLFLDGVLHGLLEDVPLHVRQNMWF